MTASASRATVRSAALVVLVAALVPALPPAPARAAPPSTWFADAVKSVSDQTVATLAAGQIAGTLQRRADAVRHHDQAAFIAGTARAQRLDQRRTFSWLADVPFVRYHLDPRGAPDPQRWSAGAVQQSVRVSYRLPGDRTDVVRLVTVGFQRRGDRWWLRGWHPAKPDLWELGPVDAVQRGPALVLASTAHDPALVDRLATLTVESLRAVDRAWPYRWARRATVQLPQDAEAMARLLAVDTNTRGLAGVTTTAKNGDGQTARVVINPAYYPTLVPLARQIVLRHELTHVAQHGFALTGVPMWLAEGLAEHVGYSGSGVPRSFVAADLLAQVRAGHGPSRLPSDADFAFDAQQARRTLAYRSGWMACEFIADTYGQPALMRFYRGVATSPSSGSAAVNRSSRRGLSLTAEELTTRWLAWLQDQA